MKLIALWFILLSATFCFAQDAKQGLIVVHADPTSKTEFRQKIYSYHFQNGTYTGRDELISVSGKKDGKDYIRTDLGIPVLYKDRYLITGIGNIIDLKDKKVLFDGRASLIRCSNDSAIFYTNDAFKGKFYSVYNFKTMEYGEVKNLTFKARVGQDVEFDKSVSPFKLFLYPPNKAKVELVKDAGYGQKTGTKTPDPPMWWVDNSNLVYGSFDKENTELSFYKINVDTKKSALLGKVQIKPVAELASVQKLNASETIVYYGTKQILVNSSASVVTDQAFSKPLNGFSYECAKGASGRVVKLNDKEVGKFHFEPQNFKTNENIAALVKEIKMGEESYQQGMSVWNAGKNKWSSVDSEDILVLAGWIQE